MGAKIKASLRIGARCTHKSSDTLNPPKKGDLKKFLPLL